MNPRAPRFALGLAALAGLLVCFGLPAGGDASSALCFANVAEQAGIAARVRHGGPAKEWIAEANGSGAAVLDYDGDGRQDVVILNGSTMSNLRRIAAGKPSAPEGRQLWLYRNLGEGKFEDVTAGSGLASPDWGTGVNAADYDNDGDVDVLTTAIGRDRLFRNNGDGTFSDVSAEAGLSRQIAWHTGSAFGDYDGDGGLDLYIAGYVALSSLDWAQEIAPVCNYRGLEAFCGPQGLDPEPGVLYRNNGDGTFTDVSEPSGIGAASRSFGFTPVFEDFNGDGRPDIFVANDSAPNLLFINQGGGVFREEGLTRGVSYNAHGETQADMGVAVGDYDSDGGPDILTTTFSEDYFPLFENDGGWFEDVAFRAGLGTVTVPLLGWGCGFADFDNDGDRDVWLANGHVYPQIGKLGSSTYRQPILLLENRLKKFLPADAVRGAPANSYRAGVTVDFNEDGRLDLLAVPIDGAAVLLENRTKTAHHWIGVRLAARKGNREAIGARVEVEACGDKHTRKVRGGGGYLSRNGPGVHFGLGACGEAVRLTIRWPGGSVQALEDVEADRWIAVGQAEGE